LQIGLQTNPNTLVMKIFAELEAKEFIGIETKFPDYRLTIGDLKL